MPVVNPATEAVLTHAPVATRAQVDTAVAAAARAFPAWAATPWSARQGAVRALADALEAHHAGFVELLMREVGKDRGSA